MPTVYVGRVQDGQSDWGYAVTAYLGNGRSLDEDDEDDPPALETTA